MLTIAISTMMNNYNKTMERLIKVANSFPNINFLIISQNENSNSQYKYLENLKVIKSDSIGLSRSRNIALDIINKGWLWFQDDDFEFDESGLKRLTNELSHCKDDIFLTRIGSLENKEKMYKSYGHYERHSLLNSVKASSIEIIVNTSFIEQHRISFDIRFGLGTDLPCCEENKFLLDSFRCKAVVCYSSYVTCYHTTILENRNVDYSKNLIAKGFFLNFLPIYISLPLMLRWSLKIKTNLSSLSNFKLLCIGYLKAEKN
ncbi:glycosyltransferase [Pseudoalteromonas sp. SG45-1]|uniref:glycosyltransferase n=1 Tax=Pseudoalteromonas sp. SG45-1 TaxID=2760957 RepID=UPI0016046C67|nr:glycosyltransferase [Pseudoalteromonas sp. SG45-1]MBB1400964.1 glycosyltransferase [Pseudoalteromonas sp. SG45-1]